MKRAIFGNVPVQDAERANDGRIGIREQRIVEAAHPLVEMREDFGRVMADGDDGEAFGFERRPVQRCSRNHRRYQQNRGR